jgi:hypothetical protein
VLLDIGVAGVVVDDAVQVVVADPAGAALPVAGNTMARLVEAGELVDVDVQQRARP